MTYLQRKKLAFMSIANRIKGFVRTVSSIPPLILPDCVDNNSIINYTIDGNSVQDGTPTPENPVEVESVGEYDEETGKYKIPVVCSGKNMFDKDGFCAYYNSFGNSTLQANANDKYLGEDCFSYYAKQSSNTTAEFRWLECAFKEKTQYTISMNLSFVMGSTESRAVTFLAVSYTDGTIGYLTTTLNKNSFTYYSLVSQPSKTIERIFVPNFGAGAKIYIKDIQVEEGKTTTDYEPYVEPVTANIYLDEPLRKFHNYKDYIDFENQKVVRKIKSEHITKVDGTSANLTNYRVYLSNISKKPLITESVKNIVVLTNKFKQPTSTIYYGNLSVYPNSCLAYITSGGVNRIAYTFGDKDISTVEQGQEALGDGFEINYAMVEEEETPITLPKLPTFNGTTIYTISTSIQPTNMSATYYATSKE